MEGILCWVESLTLPAPLPGGEPLIAGPRDQDDESRRRQDGAGSPDDCERSQRRVYEATYVGGVPTTTIGAPTTGSHLLKELWTLGNAYGEIGGFTISYLPTQLEPQARLDQCEELADDVRALSALVHAVRGRWSRLGWSRVGVGNRCDRNERLFRLTGRCVQT